MCTTGLEGGGPSLTDVCVANTTSPKSLVPIGRRHELYQHGNIITCPKDGLRYYLNGEDPILLDDVANIQRAGAFLIFT